MNRLIGSKTVGVGARLTSWRRLNDGRPVRSSTAMSASVSAPASSSLFYSSSSSSIPSSSFSPLSSSTAADLGDFLRLHRVASRNQSKPVDASSTFVSARSSSTTTSSGKTKEELVEELKNDPEAKAILEELLKKLNKNDISDSNENNDAESAVLNAEQTEASSTSPPTAEATPPVKE